MEKKEQQHKRRVRYKGTHPRNYKEKYKELQPEKYADTIQKVIEKGSTPAGMHISIMVKEILDFLQIQPGQTGLDATLGYGGHTSENAENACRQKAIFMPWMWTPLRWKRRESGCRKKGYGPEILTIIQKKFR